MADFKAKPPAAASWTESHHFIPVSDFLSPHQPGGPDKVWDTVTIGASPEGVTQKEAITLSGQSEADEQELDHFLDHIQARAADGRAAMRELLISLVSTR